MADTKSVEGVVDDLLGDGFSIVDSDGGTEQTPKQDQSPKKDDTVKKEETEEQTPVKEETLEKDDTKVNGLDGKGETLLLTAEEDLDMTDKKLEETKKETPPKEKRKQGDVWVSNITRHIKATDLKKHFARHGKVMTAKIVTNGKVFFGYIVMENSDIANKCVKSLHGSTLDGRKITVSRQRPDQRRSLNDRKPTVKATPKTEKKKIEDTKEKKDTKKDDALANARRVQDRLRRDLDYYKRELCRIRKQLTDEQRHLRIEQSKSRGLNRDLQEAENKLRDERRKMEREKEALEKTQRNDRIKLETDRSMIKKELDEVKKLREYLKRKLEEEQSRNSERRHRASSPYAYSSKRFRESSGDKGKYLDDRTRTPPSPPKLSSRSKRSPVTSFSVEKDRRGPSHHYDDLRHGSSIVIASKPSAPAAPRNIWPSFHQEVWRLPPSASSTPFSGQNSYQRAPEYSSSSGSNKLQSYSTGQREFSKREHYGSSVRKY